MAGDSDGRGGVGRGSTGSPGGGSSSGSSSGAGRDAAGGGGNGGFGDPSTHTNFGGSSVSRGYAETGTVDSGRQAGGFMSSVDTGGGLGSASGREATTRTEARARARDDSEESPAGGIASGTIASMADVAERSFGYSGAMGNAAQAAAAGYGGAMGNAAQAASMTREQHTASLQRAGVPDTIQENARPGMLEQGLAMTAGLLGGLPGALAGQAINTASAANEASDTIAGINDRFGTSLDDSFSNSFGKQAVASAASFAGGKLGGAAGARLGASAGLPGVIAGGLLGSAMGSKYGREAAFSDGVGNPADTPSGFGEGGFNDTQAVASATMDESVATPTNGFGFADFDGYASYAESFFA